MRDRRDGFSRARSLFYGRVTVEDVPEIVDRLVKGEPVKRLMLNADQLSKSTEPTR